jgi:hypothetical protein
MAMCPPRPLPRRRDYINVIFAPSKVGDSISVGLSIRLINTYVLTDF